MYADESNGYNRLGQRDGCRLLITHAHRENKMEILPEAHGRSSAQNQPLESLRVEKLWRPIREEEFGPQSDSTSFPLTRDTPSLPSPSLL